MKLRYISLHIESEYDSGIDKNFSYKFSDNSRFISNYLSKAVRKFKIEIDNFKMISICPSDKINEITVRLLPYDEVLKIEIPFHKDEQQSYLEIMSWEKRYEYYLSLIEKGFRIANTYCDIQLDRLLEMTEQFRANNYKNDWLFAKKILREHDLYLFFKCYFTHCDFRLELEVYNHDKNSLLLKKIVLQTEPSEFCYDYRFRKIEMLPDKIIIWDNHEPAFEFDIELLSKGIFNITRLNDEKERFKRDIKMKNYIQRIKLLNEL